MSQDRKVWAHGCKEQGKLYWQGWLYCWSKTFHFEIGLFQKRCSLEIEIGGEEQDGMLHIALPYLIDFYFIPQGFFRSKESEWFSFGRTIGIRVFDWAIWWELWTSDFDYKTRFKKWQRGCFNLRDFVLGDSIYSQRDREVIRSEVPIRFEITDESGSRGIERIYPCTMRFLTAFWRRPRWPFLNKVNRVEVTFDVPIPHAGRGENSWDIEDDATVSYMISAPFLKGHSDIGTESEVIEYIQKDTERWQKKYGLPREY